MKSCDTITLVCHSKYIRQLNNKAFIIRNCKYSRLEVLILYNNNIKVVSNIHFKMLPNLTNIYLNSNQITIISKFLFSKNKILSYINLSYNRIIRFVLDIDNLPLLKYLDLSVNYISILKKSIFNNYLKEGINQVDKVLDISDNSFSCVCNIMWLSNLQAVDIINVTYLDTDICINCLLKNKCTEEIILSKKKCDIG